MNYEERRIEVCNKCTLHETCGFVLRNMDNKCSDLDDIMLGWELGQQDTLEEIEAITQKFDGFELSNEKIRDLIEKIEQLKEK